jgi:hypothetical protein
VQAGRALRVDGAPLLAGALAVKARTAGIVGLAERLARVFLADRIPRALGIGSAPRLADLFLYLAVEAGGAIRVCFARFFLALAGSASERSPAVRVGLAIVRVVALFVQPKGQPGARSDEDHRGGDAHQRVHNLGFHDF